MKTLFGWIVLPVLVVAIVGRVILNRSNLNGTRRLC